MESSALARLLQNLTESVGRTGAVSQGMTGGITDAAKALLRTPNYNGTASTWTWTRTAWSSWASSRLVPPCNVPRRSLTLHFSELSRGGFLEELTLSAAP